MIHVILIPLVIVFIALSFLLLVLYFRNSSNDQNSMAGYNSVKDWWAPDSPYLGLLRSNATRVPYFSKFIPMSPCKVLDVGCGAGFLAEAIAQAFPKSEIVGLDLSKNAIQNAQQHGKSIPNLKYQVASATSLPFPDRSIDVVIASDVLEHIPDLDCALKEISRVLKPGGVFLFDCISKTRFSYWFVYLFMQEIAGIIPKGAHDFALFVSPLELSNRLRISGFSTIDTSQWLGRGWRISVIQALLKWDIKAIVTGMWVDPNDLSGPYMGVAIR